MRRIALLAVAASSLWAGADDVSAQSLVPKQVVLQEYGACMVRQAPGRSKALLATELGTKDEAELGRQVAMAVAPCLKGRWGLSMQTGAIRGAAAEAMFARDPQLLDRLAALPPAPAQRPAVADGRAFVIAYSSCLEQASPSATATLLRTAITSEQERAAFLGYGDVLKDCMPVGQRYSVNITDIRNHVAAIAYRRLVGRTGAQ